MTGWRLKVVRYRTRSAGSDLRQGVPVHPTPAGAPCLHCGRTTRPSERTIGPDLAGFDFRDPAQMTGSSAPVRADSAEQSGSANGPCDDARSMRARHTINVRTLRSGTSRWPRPAQPQARRKATSLASHWRKEACVRAPPCWPTVSSPRDAWIADGNAPHEPTKQVSEMISDLPVARQAGTSMV